VQLGEVDAAFVYASQARSAGTRVSVVRLPAAARVAASYAAVVLKASGTPALATDFVAWLASPPATAVLARYGLLGP
jgi:molybdate transport system substrate-binding protein